MKLAYTLAAQVIRALYRRHARGTLENRIAFLSRQGDAPPAYFTLLEEALCPLLPGWDTVFGCYRDAGSAAARLSGTLEQIRLAAHARLVILDGWNPAVSIPELRSGTVVVQLWHALGALKQFGWQNVGRPYGRSVAQAEALRMHRNYDVVVAGGPGAVEAYSAAFDMPRGQIAPWGNPIVDILSGRALREESDLRAAELAQSNPVLSSGAPNVLYAPTFRTGPHAEEICAAAIGSLARAFEDTGFNLIMCPHPVFSEVAPPDGVTVIRGASSADLFRFARYVVTDYSAVSLEAAVAGREVLFFCPDIEEYRDACGFNVDPVIAFPDDAFVDAASLVRRIAQGRGEGEGGAFPRFAREYLGDRRGSATDRVARNIVALLD